ncbi:MAG: helix-turn-helix transcriptional regulator [Clostridiaceae bacterium]
MKIGKRIKDIKVEKNLKLREMASDTGLSVSYLSDIINDRTDPSLKTLLKISKSLGVTNSYLLEEEEVYKVEGLDELQELLRDFPSWPKEHQNKVIEYIKERRLLIELDKNK